MIDNIYSEETEGPVGQLYGFLAEQRIEWIKSDKSWYFQDREELVKKIEEIIFELRKDERGWQWDWMMFCYGHANWKEFTSWMEE